MDLRNGLRELTAFAEPQRLAIGDLAHPRPTVTTYEEEKTKGEEARAALVQDLLNVDARGTKVTDGGSAHVQMSGQVRPRQGTEICNFGAPSPLEALHWMFCFFSSVYVQFSKTSPLKSGEKSSGENHVKPVTSVAVMVFSALKMWNRKKKNQRESLQDGVLANIQWSLLGWHFCRPRGLCEASKCLAAKIDSPLSRGDFSLVVCNFALAQTVS